MCLNLRFFRELKILHGKELTRSVSTFPLSLSLSRMLFKLPVCVCYDSINSLAHCG